MTDQKKRILIFSTAYHPFIGGAEIAVQEITKRLPQYTFTLITARLRSDLPQKEIIGNVTVHRIGTGSRWDKFRLLFLGRKYAEKLGSFDCVWAIMASYAGFAGVFYKKKHPNVPFFLTLQEGDSFSHIYCRVWFVWPWFRQIFIKVDRIQAISTYLANWARRMGARCPVMVVPNGVDVDTFQDTRQLYLKSDSGMKEDDRVVVTISRLVKKNGIRDLVEAIKFLPSDVHLLILGEGPLRRELERISGARTHFLGNVKHEDLPAYLGIADVFCRPSISEGLGIAFLEAMAAGVPVVATPVGGITDFLKDGETGLFCRPKDSKDIAEKIQRVLDDSDLAGRLRENGRALVRSRYTWDQVAREMKQIFEVLHL